MMATASARLRILCCSLIINGHVATTIIAAQTIAEQNGRRTQNEAPMRIIISSTASTVRVRSRFASELEGSVSHGCRPQFTWIIFRSTLGDEACCLRLGHAGGQYPMPRLLKLTSGAVLVFPAPARGD